ncbi:serine/threonine protein kinase [Aphanomyces invadans]|uniref:Serine/threonine protein kinase n=1 Tax=Aphanomyces invadans TaxID=157072 RepID=A0A024TAZ3_9STRA|nr:serine/threonine protein kinase [Aphanomyces invadans]ETV90492.1 serine/threonine protein kinase [Aphanomyces invadans]|eukprot:XP_008880880.1 serine/threonine protein kinase [Aphanomyces invadans]
MERYTTETVLAKALYGDVVLAVDTLTGSKVAIKRMHLDAATMRTSIQGIPIAEDIVMEKQVNRAVSGGSDGCHPYIMRMLRDFEEDGMGHFVFEFCAGGELFEQTLPMDTMAVARIFRQVVHAVKFLHDRGYVHRDISLENVLLDANGNAKLCDFGLATTIDERSNHIVGKAFYMAPEMYLRQGYMPAPVDVWALGIMLLILLTGAPPFARANDSDNVFQYVKQHGITSVLRAWKVLHLVPLPALDLLEKMLVVDPTKRLSMDGLLHHPFLRENLHLVSMRGRKRMIVRKWLAKMRRRLHHMLRSVLPSMKNSPGVVGI